jgi:stage II sporulation protein D
VNILPAEQYLCGVVLGELGERAPLEAMKAQAVAARNYALYEYKTRKSKLYHVTKTTKSQVYLPKKNYSSQIREAVNGTRGIIMAYDNKLFKSYYSSTCGGRTANIEDVWSCLPQVPLTSVTCDFCNDASYYRWEYKLTRHELKRKLHDSGFRLDYISKVYVPEKGRGISGRVRYVKIEVDKQHHHGTVILTGLHLRKILNRESSNIIKSNIKSTWFRIKEQGSTILFTGKGFGHGVGMCQEGSMEMARAGYTFKDILTHYYSGISFLRIY